MNAICTFCDTRILICRSIFFTSEEDAYIELYLFVLRTGLKVSK